MSERSEDSVGGSHHPLDTMNAFLFKLALFAGLLAFWTWVISLV